MVVFNERPKIEYEGQCLAWLLHTATSYHQMLGSNTLMMIGIHADKDDDHVTFALL